MILLLQLSGAPIPLTSWAYLLPDQWHLIFLKASLAIRRRSGQAPLSLKAPRGLNGSLVPSSVSEDPSNGMER